MRPHFFTALVMIVMLLLIGRIPDIKKHVQERVNDLVHANEHVYNYNGNCECDNEGMPE